MEVRTLNEIHKNLWKNMDLLLVIQTSLPHQWNIQICSTVSKFCLSKSFANFKSYENHSFTLSFQFCYECICQGRRIKHTLLNRLSFHF